MWYRELKRRGISRDSTINVLWKDDERPLYLMDNHRAAFWCWAQHVTPADSYGLIHVDWHWDGAGSSADSPATLEPLRVADFRTFDAALLPRRKGGLPIPVVRWDDYIDAFLRVCPNMTEAHLAVQEDRGSTLAGKLEDALDDGRARLHAPGFNLDGVFGAARVPLIVSVDLDYFFHVDRRDHPRAFDLDFIKTTFETLGRHWDQTTCMTIALSPECCGGWAPAEEAAQAAFQGLGVPWPLPPGPTVSRGVGPSALELYARRAK